MQGRSIPFLIFGVGGSSEKKEKAERMNCSLGKSSGNLVATRGGLVIVSFAI